MAAPCSQGSAAEERATFGPAIMNILGIPGHVIIGYADYLIEIGVLVYLSWKALRGQARGLFGITAYILASVGFGGLRMYAAFRYGPLSHQYGVYYWLTDYALIFALFLLITSFFRRVCGEQLAAWRRIRMTLLAVFIVTGAVSYVIIAYGGHNFFPYFVVEFQQDLYFACLVLITALYLMVVKFEHAEDQLGLLVTGLGMMFAGSCASYAFVYASHWAQFAAVLSGYIPQFSDIAMLSVWFYTAARVPKRVPALKTGPNAQGALPATMPARAALRT